MARDRKTAMKASARIVRFVTWPPGSQPAASSSCVSTNAPRSIPSPFALKNPTVKDETLDDVSVAIAFLKSRPEVDVRRIAIVGHSLGGTLAPRIAPMNPSVSQIVILAGATRPLADIVVAQVEYLAGLNGPVDDAAMRSIGALKTARRAPAPPASATRDRRSSGRRCPGGRTSTHTTRRRTPPS